MTIFARTDDRRHDAVGLAQAVVDAAEQAQQRQVRVGVVGLGYVGLPTALALAEAGHHVVGLDVSPARRAAIDALSVDLLDRDLQRLARHRSSDRFVIGSDAEHLADVDVVIICVPTPVDEHHTPDLSALRSACMSVVTHARAGQLVILTSTTYVGSTRDLLVEPLARRGLVAGRDVYVAFSPERIDPGNDTFTIERTPRVVGGHTAACLEAAALFLASTAPLVHPVSSCEAAEMAKLHENTFRAVNIAYVNEIADVCDALSLDVTEVIDAAATKPYGFMPFRPGAGVGGHCIPCDPHYLLWQLRARRTEAPVIDAAMRGIATRPGRVVRHAKDALAEAGVPVVASRVLVIGIAYKPGVADIRESPALEIISALRAAGAHVGYHDNYVPSVSADGSVLTNEPRLDPTDWDLVVVHTAHPGLSLGPLLGRVPIVDATYATRRAA